MSHQAIENEPVLAVSWDFGQTLAELDTEMLSGRCAERGVEVPVARLDASVMPAWRAYNTAVRAGGLKRSTKNRGPLEKKGVRILSFYDAL
jgi:hypothetical protein